LSFVYSEFAGLLRFSVVIPSATSSASRFVTMGARASEAAREVVRLPAATRIIFTCTGLGREAEALADTSTSGIAAIGFRRRRGRATMTRWLNQGYRGQPLFVRYLPAFCPNPPTSAKLLDMAGRGEESASPSARKTSSTRAINTRKSSSTTRSQVVLRCVTDAVAKSRISGERTPVATTTSPEAHRDGHGRKISISGTERSTKCAICTLRRPNILGGEPRKPATVRVTRLTQHAGKRLGPSIVEAGDLEALCDFQRVNTA